MVLPVGLVPRLLAAHRLLLSDYCLIIARLAAFCSVLAKDDDYEWTRRKFLVSSPVAEILALRFEVQQGICLSHQEFGLEAKCFADFTLNRSEKLSITVIGCGSAPFYCRRWDWPWLLTGSRRAPRQSVFG